MQGLEHRCQCRWARPCQFDVEYDEYEDEEACKHNFVVEWVVEKLEKFATLHLRSVKLE